MIYLFHFFPFFRALCSISNSNLLSSPGEIETVQTKQHKIVLEQVIVYQQYNSVYVNENHILESTNTSDFDDSMNYFRSRFLNRDSKANIGSLYDSDRALRSVNIKIQNSSD